VVAAPLGYAALHAAQNQPSSRKKKSPLTAYVADHKSGWWLGSKFQPPVVAGPTGVTRSAGAVYL
jgi:hypothetical protein